VISHARELNQTPSSLRCAASASRSRPAGRSARLMPGPAADVENVIAEPGAAGGALLV